MNKKIYIIRKYILANSAKDAISKDKKSPVDDCWVEENTHKEFLMETQKKQIGFKK